MTFADVSALVEHSPSGVVLLEGRRSIPAEFAPRAEAIARALALHFPFLRFRSGNAEGSDEAFSRGVASVDPARLQIVAPYQGHRKKAHIAGASYASPTSLGSADIDEVARLSIAANPARRELIALRERNPRFAAKAAYLLRDTMKVLGHSDQFTRPVCALFYIDPADPYAGGTGHTVKVCEHLGVPYAFQSSWAAWFANLSA